MENWGIYSLDFPQSSPQGILDDKKKCRLESPQSSLWFPLAPGWPEPRPKENHRENGGSAAQIFPKALHKKFWRTEKVPFFFPMVFGESSGEIWVQNPHFAYGFLWPGWFGAQNLLGVLLPPPTTKKFGYPALRNFQVFGGTKIPKIHWKEAATQSTQATKGKHRETGCFQPIFLRALPNSFIWPGWPGPKIPKPGQRKTIGERGVFSPDCPQKLSTGNFGENGKNPPVFGPSSGENLGWKPPCSPWFPLAWVVRGPKLSNYSEENHQNFGDRQGFSGDQNSPNRLGGGGHPSHP